MLTWMAPGRVADARERAQMLMSLSRYEGDTWEGTASNREKKRKTWVLRKIDF